MPAVRSFSLPQQVHLPPDAVVADAAAGDAHCLVATASGAVYVLGANDACQLGTGDKQPAVQAKELSTLGRPVARVFARGDWSAALSVSGDVAVWGTAAPPAHGSPDSPLLCSRHPYWLAWLPSGLGSSTTRVTLLALGSRHLLLHTSDGAVHACGDDTWGQLGLGADAMHDAGTRVVRHSPLRIDRLRGLRITQLAAGDAHSAAVVADGRLFTWGCAIDGRLGHSVRGDACSSSSSMCATPTAVPHSAWVGDPALAKMQAARRHDGASFLAAAAAGQQHAQPASGTERVVHVACGDTHTLAVTHTGAVWVWGAGPTGQLGLGALASGGSMDVAVPTRLEALRGVPVCRCLAGAQHSVAQVQGTDAPLFVWGAGQQGQLGRGLPAVDVPAPVHLPPSAVHAVSHDTVVAPNDGGDPHAAATAAAALEAAECHPLRGVPIGGVACGRAATLVWRPDGSALYACGSGAFGQPGQRHATSVVQQTSACLTEEQAAQAAAAVSIVRIIRPDMVAPALLDNLTAAGPFEGPVVAHIVSALLDCLLTTPFDNAYLTLYARLAHTLVMQTRGVSPYGIRAALVGAIEDAAVRVLATSVHALGAALPEAPRGGIGASVNAETDSHAGLRAAAAAARQAAAAAAAAREDGRALGAFVRELAAMQVLQREDVEDLARGCPSSLHSRGLVDSDLMGRKLAFFARMVAPPQRRVVGQPAPPVRMPPLRMSSSEEAAWRQLREAQESAKVVGPGAAEPGLSVTQSLGVRMGLAADVQYPVPKGRLGQNRPHPWDPDAALLPPPGGRYPAGAPPTVGHR